MWSSLAQIPCRQVPIRTLSSFFYHFVGIYYVLYAYNPSDYWFIHFIATPNSTNKMPPKPRTNGGLIDSPLSPSKQMLIWETHCLVLAAPSQPKWAISWSRSVKEYRLHRRVALQTLPVAAAAKPLCTLRSWGTTRLPAIHIRVNECYGLGGLANPNLCARRVQDS